ncbi:MAG: hypothetical protein ACRD2P_04670 [Terriglobia bacterium]
MDMYGRLIPEGNIVWVDGLDVETSPQQNATPAQQGKIRQVVDMPQTIDKEL